MRRAARSPVIRCARLAAVALLVGVACGPGPSARELPPLSAEVAAARHFVSAGDTLLAHAPIGAQIVLEIDLARLRANAAVGPLMLSLNGLAPRMGLAFDPLADAEVVVLCAYSLGTANADTLTLVQSKSLAEVAGSESLGRGIVAVGGPEMRMRVKAIDGELGKSMLADRAFLERRDRAVPAKAPGAFVRLTAMLDFDARVGLARMLDLSRVPTSLSVWGDVADDLAIIAELGAESAKDAVALGKATENRILGLASHPWIETLVLGYLVRSVVVKANQSQVSAVLVIDPDRLQLLVKRLSRRARAAAVAEPPVQKAPAP